MAKMSASQFANKYGATTDTKSALQKLQQQLATPVTTPTKTTTTTSTKTSSGSGGGGGGGTSTPAPSQQWSGKVEEIGAGGETVGTTYIYEGKKIAETTGGGGTYYGGGESVKLEFPKEVTVISPTKVSSQPSQAELFAKKFGADTTKKLDVGMYSVPETQQKQTTAELFAQKYGGRQEPFDLKKYAEEYESKQQSIQQPSFLEKAKEKGLKAFYSISRTGAETLSKVGELPIATLSRQGPEVITLGEAALRAEEKIRKVGVQSAAGWKDILETTGIPLTKEVPEKFIPVPRHETLMYEPTLEGVKEVYPYGITIPKHTEQTIAGTFAAVAPYIPETVAFLAAPEAYLGASALAGAEKYKNVNQIYKTELEAQYQQQFTQPLKEDERYYTKQEFEKEYGKEIKNQIEKSALTQVGTSVAFLGGAGVFKGAKSLFGTYKETTLLPTMKETAFVQVSREVRAMNEDLLGTPTTYEQTSIFMQPKIIKETTKFRDIFGLGPKKFYGEIKATSYLETPFAEKPFLAEEPYWSRTAKVSEKVMLAKPKGEFYHGTIKSEAETILNKGFKEGWVTPEIERARGYAGRKFIQTETKEPIDILQLNIPKSKMVGMDKAMGIKVRDIPPSKIFRVGEDKYLVSKKLGEPTYLAVKGKQKLIYPEEIMGLGKPTEYQVSKFLEQVKTKGVPVSKEMIPKMFGEGEQPFIGKEVTVNLFKKPVGKQIETYQTFGTVKKLAESEEGLKLYESGISFKRTTKPGYRASGEIPISKGLVLELPPVYVNVPSGGKELGEAVRVMKPANIIKTSLSRTFQETKQIQIPKITVPIPKKYPTKIIKIPTTTLEEAKPFMVGGTGLKNIPYAGTMMYERTEGAITPKTLFGLTSQVKTKEGFISIPKAREDVFNLTTTTPLSKVKLATTTIPLSKLKEELATRERTREKLGGSVIVVPKVREELKIIPQEKLGLKTIQIQKQVQRPKLKIPTIPRPRVPTTPTIKPPKITPFVKLKSKPEGINFKPFLKGKKELFIPEVKRYGKFKEISKPIPFKEALGLGIRRLRTTLGASLRVKEAKTGKFIAIGRKSREFRPGKKGMDKFILVQRAKRRLSSPYEVSEIISARRGGIKWE